MAYVENRTPERYFVSRQNREAVPRPKFLTKNFESRAILSIIFCPGGGIGRRTRLKIELRKECGFDSHPGHQNLTFFKLTDFLVGGAKRRPLILWGEFNAFRRADARLSARQDEVCLPRDFNSVSDLLCPIIL